MHDVAAFVRNDLLDPNRFTGALCYAAIYFGVATLAAHLVRRWSRRLVEHPTLFIDKTAASFIGQLLQLACFLVAATAFTHTIPALHKVGTALLASASILSIVLGLAAQNTLGNLIAGVALLFYRPFGIGDVLMIATPTGKETGTVREFSLGYTKLQTTDNRWIIAPNSVVISSVLIRMNEVK
jgi:small-conductance mechanosensitive channel